MPVNFPIAMLVFAALFALAFLTLTGPIRLATLLILALFAVKTILVELRKRLD
jgi:hypothetical protein